MTFKCPLVIKSRTNRKLVYDFLLVRMDVTVGPYLGCRSGDVELATKTFA